MDDKIVNEVIELMKKLNADEKEKFICYLREIASIQEREAVPLS